MSKFYDELAKNASIRQAVNNKQGKVAYLEHLLRNLYRRYGLLQLIMMGKVAGKRKK